MEVPCPRPERVVLQGRYARLEPLAAGHAIALYAASAGAENLGRFDYLVDSSPSNQGDMDAWVSRTSTSNDPLYFAVIDKASGRCEGRQSLMRITPEHGVIEVGGIYWGPAMSRTRVATEAVYLFMQYAFDRLGYRRFEWKCNKRNVGSKRAALRFGFTWEGLFRQHMVVKGENRDTTWFSIINSEWPAIRAAFESWLAPGNFDADGRQLKPLSACQS